MLSPHIDLAEKIFLESAKLDRSKIIHLTNKIKAAKIEYADLYFQASTTESWELEDNIIKSGHFAYNKGVGIRCNLSSTK